ncbi:uncharacterized protein V6R79_016725 [Siganus canaliculatus]
MNKLLVITVLVALLAVSAQSFRVSRQAEEEEVGTMTKIADTFKFYYTKAVNKASDCLETIKGLKLEEKAKNLYADTTTVLSTYSGIVQDQIYHTLYSQ